MANALQPIGSDTRYMILREAMLDLVNQFPGLLPGETIKFEVLESESGIAMSDNSGAKVYTEDTYVSGSKNQTCRYPFYLVYRAASSAKERQKMSIQEFLEMFGNWLCKEDAVIDGETYRLTSYPELSGGRKITRITRDNSYGTEPQENGVQDWVLPVTVEYSNYIKVT